MPRRAGDPSGGSAAAAAPFLLLVIQRAPFTSLSLDGPSRCALRAPAGASELPRAPPLASAPLAELAQHAGGASRAAPRATP